VSLEKYAAKNSPYHGRVGKKKIDLIGTSAGCDSVMTGPSEEGALGIPCESTRESGGTFGNRHAEFTPI